jgi:hypothetical protein
MRVAVGLLHWPIYDRQRTVVATNITNLDVHDIARACRVYGVERYYVIHPADEQLMFVSRLLEHCRIGDGAKFNPMRKTALTMVHAARSLEAAVADWGTNPKIVATHAKDFTGGRPIGFRTLRSEMSGDADGGLFLLFGTGFGMTEKTLESCDYLLEPIQGAPPLDYRHLSVRSAVSICLDRLIGVW